MVPRPTIPKSACAILSADPSNDPNRVAPVQHGQTHHGSTRFNTASPAMTSRCGSSLRHPQRVHIVDLLPHFVGPGPARTASVYTAPSERLKADTSASLAVKREIAVIPTLLECGLRPHAQLPLRRRDCPAVCPKVIVPLDRRASAVCTRSRRAWRDRVFSSARRSGRDGRQRGTAADRPRPAPERRRGRPLSGREPLLRRSRRANVPAVLPRPRATAQPGVRLATVNTG